MFWTELCFILVALMIGARIGGVFLGMVGGLGVGVMVFIFGLTPSTPPIDVILIILSVVLAAASLQASGGLDLLVKLAEKILRRHPRYITLLAPFICYLFTFMSGTGHVVYSLLPVISEVARDSGIRPERPLSISVIASQQAITASPISAAMAAMIGLMAPLGVSISTIMMFFVSAMVSSQAATTLILLPLGLALGLPAYALIGSWPAVNGYFFIPVAGQCLAALAFDDTGTTRIGKYVLNHSFMRPGLVNVIVSVIVGLLIGKMVLA
ncbi:TPA: anaerobic C4-dicarboxylate transporter family protein [Salmonella enterica subsp. enterica serovar Enteritidis]